MLDIICMGSIELRGTPGERIKTNEKFLPKLGLKHTLRIHSQMLNRALFTDYFSKWDINIHALPRYWQYQIKYCVLGSVYVLHCIILWKILS